MSHIYNLQKDPHDSRDYMLQFSAVQSPPLPTIPLSISLPFLLDQGQLGSCAENAGNNLVGFCDLKNQHAPIVSSRLFWYYNARANKQIDGGTNLRDLLKSAAKTGLPPEDLWPYDISKFKDTPPKAAYDASPKHTITTYHRTANDWGSLVQALLLGFPVIIGFLVYNGLETANAAQTGIVPMPAPMEQPLGGHAVVLRGYKKIGDVWHFIFRNSWGNWGDNGDGYLPFSYMTRDKLFDAWVINKAT